MLLQISFLQECVRKIFSRIDILLNLEIRIQHTIIMGEYCFWTIVCELNRALYQMIKRICIIYIHRRDDGMINVERKILNFPISLCHQSHYPLIWMNTTGSPQLIHYIRIWAQFSTMFCYWRSICNKNITQIYFPLHNIIYLG